MRARVGHDAADRERFDGAARGARTSVAVMIDHDEGAIVARAAGRADAPLGERCDEAPLLLQRIFAQPRDTDRQP